MISKFAREVGCLVIAAIIFCLPIWVYKLIISGDDFLMWIGVIVGLTLYIVLFFGLLLQTDLETIGSNRNKEEE